MRFARATDRCRHTGGRRDGQALAGQATSSSSCRDCPAITRNSVSWRPKAGEVACRCPSAGSANRLLVRKASLSADAANEFVGRLRPISDVWFVDASVFQTDLLLRGD